MGVEEFSSTPTSRMHWYIHMNEQALPKPKASGEKFAEGLRAVFNTTKQQSDEQLAVFQEENRKKRAKKELKK